MQVLVGNINCKVEKASKDELEWLVDYCRIDNKAHYHNPRAPKYFYLFNPKRGTFPAGLVTPVVKAAKKEGLSVETVDTRTPPCEPDKNADISWLRDYQKEAVYRAVKYTKGLIQIATGGGKSEVFCALTKVVPCHWMMIVNRKDLMHQAGKRYKLRTGLDYGVIGDGRWDPDPNKRFTVATFQTIYKALETRGEKHDKAVEFLHSLGGFVVDEAHTLGADTYSEVINNCVNAYYRLGVSGTALDRSDSKNVVIVGLTGPIIYNLGSKELRDRGFLAEPTVKMHRVVNISNKVTYRGVYNDLITRSKPRNKKIVEAVLEEEKPCLIFVKNVKHGQELLRMLHKAGVNAEFTWGDKSTSAREEAIKKLVRADIDALICSVIFETGIDIPELRTVIIGSGEKSPIAAVQRVGRGMRMAKDKNTFTVVDFLDEGHHWMEKHSESRKKTYEKHSYKVEIIG